jgi:hypothetical protein
LNDNWTQRAVYMSFDIYGTCRIPAAVVASGNIYGSESASGNLYLYSTANATKGKIYLGSSGSSYFDESANALYVNGMLSGVYAVMSNYLQAPTLYGGGSSGGALTLSSTYDSTKGPVILVGGLRITIGSTGVAKTLDATATVWIVTSNVTITLPSAASFPGQLFIIKRITTAGTVTVQRSGSDTIDSGNTVLLPNNYEYIAVVSNGGSIWMRVAHWYPV